MRCQGCGAEFSPYRDYQRYCSKGCYNRAHSRRPSWDCAPRLCLVCKDSFTPSRPKQVYCSKSCRGKAEYLRNGKPGLTPIVMRKYNLARYGLTPERFDQIMTEQGDRCASCGTDSPPTGWHIDHDHSCCPGGRSCGRCVRGILCSPCNTGLGHFGDDPDRLLAAAAYLLQRADVLASL